MTGAKLQMGRQTEGEMVAGVIAEYNPFHRGHLWQLQEIRKRGARYIVVAMSGDFVQRGEPALCSKYLRARMALEGGADLVLELPVSSAAASAAYFAAGGVHLLSGLGVVTHLFFGSESADMEALSSLALRLSREEGAFQEILREGLKVGLTYPAARQEAVMRLAGAGQNKVSEGRSTAETAPPGAWERILSSPNDNLALSYLLALQKQGSPLLPVSLPRKGAGHDGRPLGEAGESPLTEPILSASQIRERIHSAQREGRDLEELSFLLPPCSAELLLARQGELLFWEDFSSLLWDRLLLSTEGSLLSHREISRDLAGRILKEREYYEGMPGFISRLKTRQFTYSRVSRSLLHLLLGLKNPAEEVCYARILGFRRESSPLLKRIQENASLPLLTKPSASPELKEDALSLYSASLYEGLAAQKGGGRFIHELKRTPIVL